MRFEHTKGADLQRLEGNRSSFPQFCVEDEILKIGGKELWKKALAEVGYNDQLEARQLRAYNRLADVLNSMAEPIKEEDFWKAILNKQWQA